MPFGPPPSAPGHPGGVVSPSWQTPLTGVLIPGQEPPKKSKAPFVIIGVLVLAAAAVVGAVLVLGGRDSGGGGINAKGAKAGAQTVIDNATFDDTGTAVVSRCPLGNLRDLDKAVERVLKVDSVVDEGTDSLTVHNEGDFPAFIVCQRNADKATDVAKGPTGLYYQAVLDPPLDYKGYITDFAGSSTDVKIDEPVKYKGGDVYLFCGKANDDKGYTGCDADWVDTKNKIALNVFLAGNDPSKEDAFAALKAVLGDLADNLAAKADTSTTS